MPDTEVLSVTSRYLPNQFLLVSFRNISNSHSVQSETAGANTIRWHGDGRVSHGQHQWRGQFGGVHLQCESPPPLRLQQTSKIVYCIYNICATQPHFPSLHPVFETQTFILQKFNIAWGRDCYVSYGLWCKYDQGWILFRGSKSQSSPDCYFTQYCYFTPSVWFPLKFPFFCAANIFLPQGEHEWAAPGRHGDPGCGVRVALWSNQRQVVAVSNKDCRFGDIRDGM